MWVTRLIGSQVFPPFDNQLYGHVTGAVQKAVAKSWEEDPSFIFLLYVIIVIHSATRNVSKSQN